MREGKIKKCKYAKIENRIVEYRKRENVEMQENTEFKARHLRTFVYTFVLLILSRLNAYAAYMYVCTARYIR